MPLRPPRLLKSPGRCQRPLEPAPDGRSAITHSGRVDTRWRGELGDGINELGKWPLGGILRLFGPGRVIRVQVGWGTRGASSVLCYTLPTRPPLPRCASAGRWTAEGQLHRPITVR